MQNRTHYACQFKTLDVVEKLAPNSNTARCDHGSPMKPLFWTDRMLDKMRSKTPISCCGYQTKLKIPRLPFLKKDLLKPSPVAQYRSPLFLEPLGKCIFGSHGSQTEVVFAGWAFCTRISAHSVWTNINQIRFNSASKCLAVIIYPFHICMEG